MGACRSSHANGTICHLCRTAPGRENPDLLVAGTITLDGSDQITSAAVLWPDGTPGR